MTVKLVFSAAMLLYSAVGIAATVEYQHPQVTIVAVDESLDSVLKSLGKEMKVTVTSPADINPVINCNIKNQPIKRAFKNLLGDLSYSLVWADDGERLTGLVILAGDGETGVSKQQSSGTGNTGFASVPGASNSRQNADSSASQSSDNPQLAEHEAQSATEREEQEARMAEEREEQEAEMAKMQEEQEIAHKAQMTEERTQREAEMSVLAESLGLPPLPR